jgi:hypothetical protein
MNEIKFKNNLNCYATQWEYDGQMYRSQIFAKTDEEAVEMINAKRETEKLSGQVITQYCLNPKELTDETLEDFKDFLEG